MRIKIGSRASNLAMIQAKLVATQIKEKLGYESIIIPIKTTGDSILDRNLYDIGGKALFLKEIEESLIVQDIDLAVHSLKDIPATLPKSLIIGAVLEREDPSEIFLSNISNNIMNLPLNATIGTSSIRRKIQLLKLRPDLNIVTFRGNVDTRVDKLLKREVDATILSYAGVKRLNLNLSARMFLNIIPIQEILPAAGQGVIAIEIRKDDTKMLELCKIINHKLTWDLIQVERGFVETLQADCQTPVGALSIDNGNDSFQAHFMLADDKMKYFLNTKIIDKLNVGYQLGSDIALQFLKKLTRT